MSLLVVGSVAFDSIHTPTEERDRVLGGSAVYFSYAASYFTPVRLVGVVGEDWPDEHTSMLQSRRVDTSGLQVKAGGKTFFWKGKYMPNMNDRETLEVELNVFGDFDPHVPEAFRDSRYVFLANGSPVVQAKVLDQMTQPALVVADTMDLWIQISRHELESLLQRIDLLVLNDSEAKLMMDTSNVVSAGHSLRAMGPKYVIIKKGEHGAMLFGDGEFFACPAFPLHDVFDPTGAGDSFIGGFAGYLASLGKKEYDFADLKSGIARGTILASFTCESFSTHSLHDLTPAAFEERLAAFRQYCEFA